MASGNGPFAGVISPKLCWSAHGNELHIFSAVDLEGHVGHDTSGLREQVVVQFVSSAASSHPHTTADETGTGRGMLGASARNKLLVRSVESLELEDGRTVLLCLVSSPELESEIHCIEPVMGSTIGIVTELPVMLIKLAVLPVGLCRAQRGAVSEHGRDRRRSVGARASNEGGFEEVVVAVAGVVGRIQLVGIKLHRDPIAAGTGLNTTAWPSAGEHAPADQEGVPVSTLTAFATAGKEGNPGAVMVAAGWEDGRWAVVSCSEVGTSCGESTWGLSEQRNAVTGDTRGNGPALHIVHQSSGDDTQGSVVCQAVRLWVTTSTALLLYELSTAPSASQSAHLLRTYRRKLVTNARPQCLHAMAVGGGLPRELFAFTCLRPSDAMPVLQILDPGKVGASSSETRTAMTDASKEGGYCEARPAGRDIGRDRSIFERDLSNLYRRARGRTAAAHRSAMTRHLMYRMGLRGNTGVIRDVPPGSGADGGRGSGLQDDPAEDQMGDQDSAVVVKEVDLSTRCCGRSVVTALPDAVWVNPSEVKVFASGRATRGSAGREGGKGTEGGGSNEGGNGDEVAEARVRCGALESLGERREDAAGARNDSSEKLHLKLSIIVAEASLSETGRTRVRAWQNWHVGDAHRVALEAEKLGYLAFCDPSQEPWDCGTKRRMAAVAEETLEYVIGTNDIGGGDDYRAGTLWGQRHSSLSSTDLDFTNNSSNEPNIVMIHQTDAKRFVTADTGSSGYWLAVRLQAAVMLGRGPVVARALTARVRGGNEWVLRRARPVQEWAAVVARESWEEAQDLLGDESTNPGPNVQDKTVLLDSLARRTRQLERILEASLERCRLYYEALTSDAPAVLSGIRRTVSQRQQQEQQQREAKISALPPLQSRLRRALVTARLTSGLTSAASFALRAQSAKLAVAAAELDPARSAAEFSRERSSTGSIEDERRVWRMGTEIVAVAEDNTPAAESSSAKSGKMVSRLLQLAELTGGDARRASSQGAASEAVGMLRVVREVATIATDANGTGEDDETAFGRVARFDEKDALGLLENGLVVAAYRVMGAAFNRNMASVSAKDEAKAVRQRVALEAAERELDLFCEQVRLAPDARTRARLSWLLDNKDAARGALPSAGSALLSPRAVAALGDQCLLKRAAAALVSRRVSSIGGESLTGKKRMASAFAPLAEELLRLAVLHSGSAPVPGLRAESDADTAGARISLVPSRTVKRSRHSFPPDIRTMRGTSSGGARESHWGTPNTASQATRKPDGHPRNQHNGDQACLAVETSKDTALTPRTDNALRLPRQNTLGGSVVNQRTVNVSSAETSDGNLDLALPRVRDEQQPIMTPGKSLKAAGVNEENKDIARRERGQTVWQTPRGVGLTPFESPLGSGEVAGRATGLDGIARIHHCTPTSSVRGVAPLSDFHVRGSSVITAGMALTLGSETQPEGVEASGVERRGRGQTMWETPKGVGLTPKHSEGSRLKHRFLVAAASGKKSHAGNDAKGSGAAHGQASRPRGQTMWQTPRGVGLTPQTPSRARPEQDCRGSESVEPGPTSWCNTPVRSSGLAASSLGQMALRSYAEGH